MSGYADAKNITLPLRKKGPGHWLCVLCASAVMILSGLPAHAADPGDACTAGSHRTWQVSETDPDVFIHCDGTQWRIKEIIDESGAATSRIKQVITFGADAATCDSDAEGTVRYNSGDLEWCDGSVWSSLTGDTDWTIDDTNSDLSTDYKVGIDTTSPLGKLHIADNGSTAGDMLLNVGDDTYFTDLDVANALGLYGRQNSAQASLKLGSAGPTISGYNGNVGIGTTSPGTELEVNGTITAAKVTGLSAPTANSDAANKEYVDAAAGESYRYSTHRCENDGVSGNCQSGDWLSAYCASGDTVITSVNNEYVVAFDGESEIYTCCTTTICGNP